MLEAAVAVVPRRDLLLAELLQCCFAGVRDSAQAVMAAGGRNHPALRSSAGRSDSGSGAAAPAASLTHSSSTLPASNSGLSTSLDGLDALRALPLLLHLLHTPAAADLGGGGGGPKAKAGGGAAAVEALSPKLIERCVRTLIAKPIVPGFGDARIYLLLPLLKNAQLRVLKRDGRPLLTVDDPAAAAAAVAAANGGPPCMTEDRNSAPSAPQQAQQKGEVSVRSPWLPKAQNESLKPPNPETPQTLNLEP